MKAYIITLAWLAVPAMLLAQHETGFRRTVFKISPQHFTQEQLKVGIERFNKSLNKSVVLYAYGMLQNHDEQDYFSDMGYTGLGGEGQFRTYLSPMTEKTTKGNKSFYQGIYLAGFLQGAHFSSDQVYRHYYMQGGSQVYEEYQIKTNVGNWAFGFTFGIQRTIWNIMFIEAYVGGGLQFSDVISYPTPPQYYYGWGADISSPEYQGVLPKIGLQIGIGL